MRKTWITHRSKFWRVYRHGGQWEDDQIWWEKRRTFYFFGAPIWQTAKRHRDIYMHEFIKHAVVGQPIQLYYEPSDY